MIIFILFSNWLLNNVSWCKEDESNLSALAKDADARKNLDLHTQAATDHPSGVWIWRIKTGKTLLLIFLKTILKNSLNLGNNYQTEFSEGKFLFVFMQLSL